MTERKSRHLSIYEYFEKIQLEFMSFQLRSKIYPYETHKNFWRGAMEKKKKTVEEVSDRNKIGNIFNDSTIEEKIREKFFQYGIPNFQYRDEAFKKVWEYWDKFNYFYKNSDVRVETGDGTIIGKIIDYTVGESIVHVISEGKIYQFDITKVFRIL